MKREGKDYKFFNEVEWFDSFEEACETTKNSRKRPDDERIFDSWSTSRDCPLNGWEDVARLNRTGWKEGAKKLAPVFDAASLVQIEADGGRMALDYAGFMPCVPSYLAGEPMHMRRKIPARNSKAPIRIFVGLGVSGGISNKEVEARAVAIACLVMFLNRFRAVTLYTTACMMATGKPRQVGYYMPVIKIGTLPMDLSVLAWQLTTTFAFRGVMMRLGNYGSDSTTISWAGFKTGNDAYTLSVSKIKETIKPILGMTDDDLYIPDAKLHEDTSDPIKWAKVRMVEMGYKMD